MPIQERSLVSVSVLVEHHLTIPFRRSIPFVPVSLNHAKQDGKKRGESERKSVTEKISSMKTRWQFLDKGKRSPKIDKGKGRATATQSAHENEIDDEQTELDLDRKYPDQRSRLGDLRHWVTMDILKHPACFFEVSEKPTQEDSWLCKKR